jgi:hypothetical protein
MVILLLEALENRALNLDLANAPYPETTTTLLKAQTTFVDSCFKSGVKRAKRPLPI